MGKKKKTLSAVLATAIAVMAFVLLSGRTSPNVEAYKNEVLASIDQCLKAEKKNSCFKEISQEFVEKDRLEAVFSLMEENQQTPRIFESCHVFLHFVGQAAYKKFGNVNDALKEGDYVCFAGYYHGALEGYFIENNLLASEEGGLKALREKVPLICVEDEEGLRKDYLECLHGLGHGLMFATDGELPLALELCDSLGSGEKASWCYSGAFMENSTSTTNPDHPSKYLKENDQHYPCNVLEERYKSTCYILQSMHVTHDSQADWSKTIAFCDKVPTNHRSACFDGMGQSLIGFTTDTRVVRDNCLRVSQPYQKDCITGAVGGIGERYKPPFDLIANLCSVFNGRSLAACYEGAFQSMNNWSKDEDELEAFCEAISERDLRDSCLTKTSKR